MPVIRAPKRVLSGGKYQKAVVRSQTRSNQRPRLSLERSVPSNNLFDYPFLVYGEPKIGKTTLLNEIPNNYFYCFERNDSYRMFKTDVDNWGDFEQLVADSIAGNHPYKMFTIDPGEAAYQNAFEYACETGGFEHPQDVGHGKGWSRIRSTFLLPCRKLMLSKFGFCVTAHGAEVTIETQTGRQFVRMMPQFSKQSKGLFVGEIHNIFYYHYIEDTRWLQIQGDEYVVAGHRMSGHFLTPKGETVFRIPMGTNEKEAYQNLVKAFNNQQVHSYREVGKVKRESDTVKKESGTTSRRLRPRR